MARGAKKKSTAKKLAARRPKKRAVQRRVTPTQGASSTEYRAKVRMYRQGLGDCFLITLPRTDGSRRPFFIMIDCGVVLGTADPGTIMTRVVDDIIYATGGEVDLLLVTHEHWDHLSGFVQARESFARLKVRQVWLAWTEDLRDELAKKLKKENSQAIASLRQVSGRLQSSGNFAGAEGLGSILELFGASDGANARDAMNTVKAKVVTPRFCDPLDAPVVPPGVSARIYVLGPPRNEMSLRVSHAYDSRGQIARPAMDGLRSFLEGPGAAFGETDRGRPFDRQYEISFSAIETEAEHDSFRQRYFQPEGNAPDDWRRIDYDWLDDGVQIGLELDSLANNTSLAVAVELAPEGDVLLFTGDAQLGSWLSWQDLKWTVDTRDVTARDLLNRAIFYKVGHHGSRYATPRRNGLEQMRNLRVAMIPVDHDMAVRKRWGEMPLVELVMALREQARGVVLRGDDKAMPASHEDVVEGPAKLFYEVTF